MTGSIICPPDAAGVAAGRDDRGDPIIILRPRQTFPHCDCCDSSAPFVINVFLDVM